ncbi:MAG: hypothetical protein Ta2G_21700 [Termitinemataceae bacterium]|nr:MAG: hypothetical protein Ta2G_21700 [Termitinemataceae bacterium]
MDELTGAFVNSCIEVADRNNLEYVYKELGLQMSGDVSDKTALSVGKFVGAKYVITGQLLNAGSSYRYRINAINVETAVHEGSVRLNVQNDRDFKKLLAAVTKNASVTRAAKYAVTENTRPTTAGTYLDRGLLFASRGEYDMAIEAYSEAIKLDPNDADAYYNRGIAYANKRDYDRAITDYSQAIKIDPNYAVAYYNRGNEYRGKGDYDRAVADYSQAIKIDPNYAAVYLLRGIVYADKGDYDRAIADYTQALKLNPNHPYAKKYLEEAKKKAR